MVNKRALCTVLSALQLSFPRRSATSPRSDCSGWQSKSPSAQLTSGRKERGEDGNEEHKRIIQSGTGVLRIAKKVAHALEVVHSNMFKMKKKGVLRQSSSEAECLIINTAGRKGAKISRSRVKHGPKMWCVQGKGNSRKKGRLLIVLLQQICKSGWWCWMKDGINGESNQLKTKSLKSPAGSC